jgi:hypothetical protein
MTRYPVTGALAAFLKRHVPTNRKRSCYVSLTDKHTVYACELQWSGGSKTSYVQVNGPLDRTCTREYASWGTSVARDFRYEIEPTQALIAVGTSSGKADCPHIYCTAVFARTVLGLDES